MKEVGQKWAKYGRIPFIGNVQKRQIYRDKKQISWGTFLVVQWLRLYTPNTGGTSLIPDLGTKIPTATGCKKKPSRLVGIRGWGREGWEISVNGRVSFWCGKNVLELDSDDIDLFTLSIFTEHLMEIK